MRVSCQQVGTAQARGSVPSVFWRSSLAQLLTSSIVPALVSWGVAFLIPFMLCAVILSSKLGLLSSLRVFFSIAGIIIRKKKVAS